MNATTGMSFLSRNRCIARRLVIIGMIFGLQAVNAADILLFDDFADGDLAVGGAGTINGGFTAFTSSDSDIVTEASSNAMLVAGTNYRRCGFYSTAIDVLGGVPASRGVGATFEFSSMDLPSGELSHTRAGLGELYFTIVRKSNGTTSYGMGIRNNFDNNQHNYDGPNVLGTSGNDSGLYVKDTTLEDGFTVVIKANSKGWSLYLIDALDTAGNPIVHSGTWAAVGTSYTEVFDRTKIGSGSTNNRLTTINVAGVVVSHEARRQTQAFTSSLDLVKVTQGPLQGTIICIQ